MPPTELDKRDMPAVEAMAREWTVDAVRRESARVQQHGSPKVWRRVAVRLGLASGTVEGIARGRTKDLTLTVFERVRSGVIRELEAEIARLHAQLATARAAGLDHRSAAVSRAEAAVAAARIALDEALK